MTSEGQNLNYWDAVALEAEKEHSPVVKWRRAARNWLAHYVEKRRGTSSSTLLIVT